ncbi:MAG TPA: MucB/RseB C-terminal domain-containing protein [Gammaproteobacteria bacterium]
MFNFRWIFLLFLPLAAMPAHANFGDNPGTWLEQMETALETIDYQGTFVYIHGDQAETMLVFHRVGPDGTRERLVSLNGSAREVLRNDDEVKCILPDDKVVFVEKRHEGGTLAQGIPLNAVRNSDHYEFELLGTGRIAGRSAQLIAIKPRDEFRYGYHLWLDEQTALPLRSELVNESGEPIEKMMFTEIEIGVSIDDEQLAPSVSGEDFTWHVNGGEEKAVAEMSTPVKFDTLPPGYEIVSAETRKEAEQPSWHLVISDGLASVSVFAEPLLEGKPSLAGLSTLGAVNAFGVRLDDHHITVVGEVPEATVTAIGEAASLAEREQ